MSQLLKLFYLRAMGIDHYVSRTQLPGAAPTRRLAIIPSAPAETVKTAQASTAPAHSGAAALLRPEPAKLETRQQKPAVAPAQGATTTAANAASPAISLNLAAIFAGGVAWLESLDGRPLAKDQVRLVHAMARALGGAIATPKVAQFDWPMHNSRQLDQGGDAARAALAAFLRRHIDEQGCKAIVSLGTGGAQFVDSAQLDAIPKVITRSTLEMLENPDCKRQVWADLQAIARSD